MLLLTAIVAACDSGGGTPTFTPLPQPTQTTISAPTLPPTTAPTVEPTKADTGAAATQTAAASLAASPTVQATAAVTGTQGTAGEARMIIETPKGKIVLKLFTDPSANVQKTIANFAQKANSGYFNGLTFHRVEDWVVQGGDPTGTGSGGSTMPSEYNQIPFATGSLGVARRNDPALNNDSQFFIVKDGATAAALTGQYTNFGEVVEGMDVVNQLAVGDKMTSVRVEGFDPSAIPTAAPTTVPTPAATAAPAFMTIETAKGKIVLQLYTDLSAGVSNTIQNFTKKANNGFFDGLTFHRVEDWVIQGGDPSGNGTGGGTMPSEYNQIPFATGSLGVARGGDPAINSDSQFFIVKRDSFHLNGQYTNWGKVIEGMDVVNQIAAGDKIDKIRIEGVPIVQEPDHITVQHVLIAFEGAVGFQGREFPEKAKGRTQEQAKTLANDILNRAKGGEDFQSLMDQYSDDTGGGTYGMANTGVTAEGDEAQRSGMVAAFGDVGFKLQEGEIGLAEYDPTTSPFGYHIIKRTK